MKSLPFILSALSFCTAALSSPPREIPVDMKSDYTLDGKIPVSYWYWDGTYSKPLFYAKNTVDQYIQAAENREVKYYSSTDTYLYRALDTHLDWIKGKRVGIIGSVVPWYESIILAYGGIPVTIEYNQISTDDERLNILTVEEYKKNPEKFDAILSISSYEHDGLGRYGDPMDPNGDLRAMKETLDMLTDNGRLFIAVPVGPDYIVWNAHRVYGSIRLPMLFASWNIEESYGFTKDQYTDEIKASGYHQPVFVLSKKQP